MVLENRFVPFAKREYTSEPVLMTVQLAPLFVERKIPSRFVPANRFVSLKANALIVEDVKPLLTALQLEPLFVESKMRLKLERC